ncbi:MAG: HAMP domain-containing sensor histidine kinase, partial [Bacteroidota bacterium]
HRDEQSPSKVFFDAFNVKSIAIYAFQNDSLIFWNNARRPFIDSLFLTKHDFGTLQQKDGLYFYVRKTKDNRVAYSLCLIHAHFDIQNNYLKNEFQEWTGLQKSIKISDTAKSNIFVQLHLKTLFGLESQESVFYSATADNVASFFFILGFCLLLLALLISAFYQELAPSLIFKVVTILILRFVLLYFNCPAFLYRTQLFDLHVFGNGQSHINAYLGDIFLNAVLFLCLALVLHFVARKRANAKTIWLILLQCVYLGLLFFQFNLNLKSLVCNSTLSFDFINVFANNWILLPLFAAYTAYIMALFVVAISLCQSVLFYKNAPLLMAAIGLCIGLLYSLFIPGASMLETIWLLCFNLMLYVVYRYGRQNALPALVLSVLLLTFTASGILNAHIHQNRLLDLEVMAQHLSENRDAILESEFNLIPEKIKQDGNFINLLNVLPSSETEVIQKLKQDYFSGYFDRYNLDFSLFDTNCNPLLPVKNPMLVNQGYFEDQIQQCKDSLQHGLYFFSNPSMPSRYIAYIPLINKRLYVLMEPKQFEETGSFPDLLIDQSLQKQNKLNNVSFGVYHAGILSNRNGDFIYPDFFRDSLSMSSANANYEHRYYSSEGDTKVVISQGSKTWKYYFTFNSYLLLISAVFIYLAYLLYLICFTSLLRASSLTRRIQTIIIVLLLCSMSAVGLISGNLVMKQFEAKNQKQLSEKTQIMLSELTGQFKTSQLFDADQYNLINLKLKEYARLFNTPISMFDGQARLVNTSENKLYDMGLAAKLANPEAFDQLKNGEAGSLCVNEKAGALDYMSMYTAIFDQQKHLIGMINLPYFARQNDLSNELSGIISALINVYVILIVISILAGLILSGYITRPLRLIQQQIAKISLGKQNEKIVWNSKDEIGKLVFEYNQMLLKLEESANQLAQSERESAWREMAKQVAHEIKNPLTPMKLNLQYLQHLKKANPTDFTEKFEKVSLGIIEQIDSLATIASEFSNFAKLPETQLQSINLVEVISSATALFNNQSAHFISSEIEAAKIMVKGDRDQCLRVFNNVLKNALQAVEEIKEPKISIRVESQQPFVIIAVSDNGCGIDDALKPKLFSPNFTTKSTGSGLGLAMVKNCMEGFGGAVYFESQRNQGSTFYLKFVPIAES